MPCWACAGATAPDPGYPALGLYRCANCGLRFVPAASLETVRDRYDASYFERYPGGKAYDEDARLRGHEAAVRLRWLRRHGAAGSLFEIGSASGYFLAAAQAAGFRPVLGIEPAAAVAQAASARFGVEVIAGVLEEAELGESRWDVACAWHALEHIAEPQAALERVACALRPGGKLFLEVPNVESVRARAAGESWFHLDPAHHVAHYGPGSLRAVLERAGLRVESLETIAPAAFLPRERAVAPRGLAYLARETLVTRAWPPRPHAWRHEFLRAVASP
jgi:SAM-dependent methyltransferase